MMASNLAGSIAVPAGIFLAGRAEISLAFIGAAVLFLPLFVFMPKLIQQGMKADTEAAINAFGKNEQVKKVFWTLFVAMAGLVLARVVDPVTAQQVVGIDYGDGSVILWFDPNSLFCLFLFTLHEEFFPMHASQFPAFNRIIFSWLQVPKPFFP